MNKTKKILLTITGVLQIIFSLSLVVITFLASTVLLALIIGFASAGETDTSQVEAVIGLISIPFYIGAIILFVCSILMFTKKPQSKLALNITSIAALTIDSIFLIINATDISIILALIPFIILIALNITCICIKNKPTLNAPNAINNNQAQS